MATQIYLGNPPENIKKWIKEEAERKYQEMLKTPLTFTAEEADSTIKMISYGSAPTIYLETSPTGEEGSWTDFTVCTYNEDTYEVNNDGTTITLTNIGDKIYFRAKQDNERFGTSEADYNYFEMTGKIAASGNLNTLLKADGSVLDLTGRDYCYTSMFASCGSSLTKAPELPATTLANDCYNNMFNGCALTQAPELPATTLASCCYWGMFAYCSSLTKTSKLPATTLADSCYSYMFDNCPSLIKAPELPALKLASYCYSSMFSNCPSLTQAPELPATTLADSCYRYMFSGCRSLTRAPALPATELAEGCYSDMFSNCKSPFTFLDKTFEDVANLIQEKCLIGEYWCYYDEEGNEIIINPVEIICSDKIMIATFDMDEWTWTLTEK